MARFTKAPTVSYRNSRWGVTDIRTNWVLIERGKGLRTHEVLWVPKQVISDDDMRRVEAYRRQLAKEEAA